MFMPVTIITGFGVFTPNSVRIDALTTKGLRLTSRIDPVHPFDLGPNRCPDYEGIATYSSPIKPGENGFGSESMP